MHSIKLFAIICASSLALACGGDDDDDDKGSGNPQTGGSIDSGLPSSTPANQLSTEETAALCEELGAAGERWANDAQLKSGMCRYAAYMSAVFLGELSGDAKGLCESTYSDCMAEPATSETQCTEPSDQCTATVGEIEKCLNEGMAGLSRALDDIPSCDELTDEIDLSVLAAANPESCEVVSQKCPEVLDNSPTNAYDGS